MALQEFFGVEVFAVEREARAFLGLNLLLGCAEAAERALLGRVLDRHFEHSTAQLEVVNLVSDYHEGLSSLNQCSELGAIVFNHIVTSGGFSNVCVTP